jgi:hypothetical protein
MSWTQLLYVNNVGCDRLNRVKKSREMTSCVRIFSTMQITAFLVAMHFIWAIEQSARLRLLECEQNLSNLEVEQSLTSLGKERSGRKMLEVLALAFLLAQLLFPLM